MDKQQQSMSIQTSASGKIILFGEHAVVYGIPAIAIPISSLRAYATVKPTNKPLTIIAEDLKNQDIKLTVDTQDSNNPLTKMITSIFAHFNIECPQIEITVKSDIPIASGLGSGAAVSSAVGKAVIQALGKTMPIEELNALVFEVEKIHHGTPSGIDNTVIVYERPVYFVKGREIEFLNIKTPFHIVVADTGKTALTHEAVGDVRKLYESNPDGIRSIFSEIEDVVQQAITCMNTGNIKRLGQLMDENHTYLQNLTVSSYELDKLVEAARQAGALGAKLSGGGRGGNMIALVEESAVSEIKSALKEAGAIRVFDSIVT
jgi:mevalonate kinase